MGKERAVSNSKSIRLWGSVLLWLTLVAFVIYLPFMPLITNKQVDLPFLTSQGSDKALVFFGFRSCDDVCPITLSTISQLLHLEKNRAKWPQVAFINIDRTSNAKEAKDYATLFHPAFVGYHPEKEELSKFSAMFGLDIRQIEEQIFHLGRLYLLEREKGNWRLKKAYQAGTFSVELLQDDFS